MKASLDSQREYERKIRQLEQKLERTAEKKRSIAKANKYLKRRVRDLTASRDKWKEKNAAKALKVKGLKKRVKNNGKAKRHHYSFLIVCLCVKLRTQAGCSYRGVCKILLILQASFDLGLRKLPCANTVENWVSKMGYYCIGHAQESLPSKEVCLILDESIKQGNERVLLLLITPWKKEKQGALCYNDVRVCYLGGKSSWTGEKIKEEVEKIVREKGIEIKGALSDEDTKLLKACRLLGLPHLPDINHAVASCLRKTFEKNEVYKSLVKQITAYQSKAVNQDLSYLRPPKQRVKARFMNQKGFVEWGLVMLEKFTELNKKEAAFFEELPVYKPMLKALERCIGTGEKIAQLLKTKGLSSQTLKQAEGYIGWPTAPFKPAGAPELSTTPSFSYTEALLYQFIEHIRCYIARYKAFLSTRHGTFNASSDIIESMFGKHKSISGTNALTGVTQLDLELPLCNVGHEDIYPLSKLALESVFMADLAAWRKTHSSDNQARKRREFFKNGGKV